MARLRQALLVVAILGAQEIVLRWIFPLPDVEGFYRLSYAGALAIEPQARLPTMANLTLWWWSQPDGASFTSHLNLYGFRGQDWRRTKPRGRERIFVVGDSLVEGLGAPDGATIPEAFAHRARESGVRLEVLNLGGAGFQMANYGRLMADAVPWFRPDHVFLVVYMNDLYDVPAAGDVIRPSTRLAPTSRFRPRLLHVLEARRRRQQVPRRWHAGAGDQPKPLAVEQRFRAAPELVRDIERFVAPDLKAAMRAGRLNPAVTNLLARSHRTLSQPVDARPFLEGLDGFLDRHAARLWVAYLPSLNQVSDRYLEAQRRMSKPVPRVTLTSTEFQVQARALAADCASLGVPFLDLTPLLQRAEAEGLALYWPYDSHMNADGYRLVGTELFRWWRAQMEAP